MKSQLVRRSCRVLLGISCWLGEAEDSVFEGEGKTYEGHDKITRMVSTGTLSLLSSPQNSTSVEYMEK